MNSVLNHVMCELSDDEIHEVNGGLSLAVAAVAVALGTAGAVALVTGIAAGYSWGVSMWGPGSQS